ncbi:hypothetical protein GCM10027084_03460 [Pseudoxanthomonas sangjuensis]|uniref:hypothetical protein n=1 Tax=Pseudoxanthomonas sangjuensis TaxID=1503750 RepID=UPI001390DA34|nr:hypothetical protein [Pseudoxanthomonas sangjuensis]
MRNLRPRSPAPVPTRLLAMLVLCVACIPAFAAERAELRVLLVGNSLTYTNNLPGLLRSLAAAQEEGPTIATASYVFPGADLAWHWRKGAVAKALRDEHWDALVLQERGGILACLANRLHSNEPDCQASRRAHRQFAELARERSVRVLLLGTWGPDPQWQAELDRGLRIAAKSSKATPVFAGTALRAYAHANPRQEMFTDGNLHPALPASLIVAASLYRELAGREAQARDLALDFPLRPVSAQLQGIAPMEAARPASEGRRASLPASELAPLLQAAAIDP